MKFSIAVITLSVAAMANAHGYFVTPKAREPGPVFAADCGSTANSMWSSDINGNVQGLLNAAGQQSDFKAGKCKVWKCKGLKYADNKANVYTYTAGQKVPMEFNIAAPHDGYANVSIISLRDNKIVSTLKTWDKYALTSRPAVASERNFQVTIPTNLGGKCTKPGQCAIQMFWDAPGIDQTYESCIDFKIGGGSAKRGEETLERMHPRDFVDESIL